MDATDPQLARIEEWLRKIAKILMGPLLEAELSDERARKLYELTGKATADTLAKKLRCSKSTIFYHWKRWERLGLVVKQGRGYRKLFDD